MALVLDAHEGDPELAAKQQQQVGARNHLRTRTHPALPPTAACTLLLTLRGLALAPPPRSCWPLPGARWCCPLGAAR